MVPPTARPVPSALLHSSNAAADPDMGDYAIAPAPTPVQILPSSTQTLGSLDLPLQGYMEMHPAIKTPVTPTLPRSASGMTGSLGRSERGTVAEHNREESAPVPVVPTIKVNPVKSKEYAGPQDELLEIIHDFKNNVFTISEVEKLVETWKTRNDVQQNLKDKQRQLMAMRDEYERIQKLMKEDMKRPTPFDRVRKFFSKGKKGEDLILKQHKKKPK